MKCPFCSSESYHLFTQCTFRNKEDLPMDQKVYKACLECNMRTGYYGSEAELKKAEDRNPFKRADW